VSVSGHVPAAPAKRPTPVEYKPQHQTKEDPLKRKTLVPLFFALALLAATTLPAAADVCIKQVRHTDPFTIMGQTQPEKNENLVIWLGKNVARFDTGGKSSNIVMLDQKKMIALNHERLTYSEWPLNLEAMVDKAVKDKADKVDKDSEAEGDKDLQEFADLAKEMAGAMFAGLEVKVTPTGETRKIKSWNCRKYIVETSMPMGKSRSESWATEDVKFDPKLYWAAANAMMLRQPGFEKVLQEMEKIKGFVVLQESTSEAMGAQVKVREEVQEVITTTAPAGTYGIPKGYKKAN
jgi:hypothetical protein